MASKPSLARGFTLAVSALLVTPSAAQDWTQFRGPNGSGIAAEAAPIEFGPERNLAWRTPLPPGLSSPIVASGRVWLTGVEGERPVTLALDAATGKIVWRRYVGRSRAETLHKLNHAASPSCTVHDGRVVSFFPDFGLVAYTTAGRELWRAPLGPFNNIYGMGASPVIAGGNVILVVDQSRDSYIAAFDARTGRMAWRTPRPEAVSGHSTPIVRRASNGRLVAIAPGSFRMDAYDVETGRAVWWAEGLPSEMKSVPVIDGGLIYVHGFNTPDNDPGKLVPVAPFPDAIASGDADRDGRLSKQESPRHAAAMFEWWDLNHDGGLDEYEWSQYALAMKAENGLFVFAIPEAGPARLVWKFQRSIPQLPSPLVYRGVVYLINESGVLTLLDAASGRLHGQSRLRGVADTYYSSPVAADGKVYIASHTGVVTVLAAGAEPRVLAANDLGEEILATPALSAGRLFVRTRNTLYCFRGQRM
ncbi:MAG: PQQ-binding-like beta-propeller repeat protein [Bryobacteraceae bacterium]